MAKLPSIPYSGTDPISQASALNAIREIVEILAGQRGDPKDRAVTIRELEAVQARLAKLEA